MLIKILILKIIKNFSQDSLILICFAQNFGRIQVFVSKNDKIFISFEEGQIVLMKILDLEFNKKNFIYNQNSELFMIFDFKNSLINSNQFFGSIIIKLICKIFYEFIFNFEEIQFFFQKLDFFEQIFCSSSKIFQIKAFLNFEFWVLFFLLDSIDMNFNQKILLQKKISLIYKKFLRDLNFNSEFEILRKIFLYFEKRIWSKIGNEKKSYFSRKIQVFLRNERRFIFEIFINCS